MVYEYKLETNREGLINITSAVEDAVENSGMKDGICVVFCPHTTAAITINENADPDVVDDLLFSFRTYYPERKEYNHMEGNSSAHLKSSLIGASETIIIEKGKLMLGTWQAIYFAEFDGPRNRKFIVKLIEN